MQRHRRPKTNPNGSDPNLFAKAVFDNLLAKADPDSIPKTPPEPEADSTKHPGAVALGKLGGSKGGHARAKSLSPKKRSQIAKKAAKARWSKS